MLAARRPCPPNKSSAAQKARNVKHILKNSLKRKLHNRDANLQAVLDDETISTTVSDGTSAAVLLLTDIAWTDVHAC